MKITRQTQNELKTHLDNYKENPNRELTETVFNTDTHKSYQIDFDLLD